MKTSQTVSIMPCLDLNGGRVVKGIKFVELRDAGDPVECCRAYCAAGADELAMLDISATVEGRPTMLSVIRDVAAVATIPITAGGGIGDVATALAVLEAGAARVSVSSAAWRQPQVISEMIRELGSGRVTLAIDAARNPALPSGYEVFIDGGRTATGRDAIEWARQVVDYGVCRLLPTSKSTDGVRGGYDLPLIRAMREATGVSVVASGGAGELVHFYEAVQAGADVLLAASVFHFNLIPIGKLREYLQAQGVKLHEHPILPDIAQ